MSVSDRFKPLFNTGDRSRGTQYFHDGHVDEIKIVDGYLMAEVDGLSGFYQVTIDLNHPEGKDSLDCTCPRFSDGHFCKHLWAALLAYETRFDTDPDVSPEITSLTDKSAKKTKPKRRAIPIWEPLLKQLNNGPGRFETSPVSPLKVATKTESEVCYIIDTSERSGYYGDELYLSLFIRSQKPNGTWGKLRVLNLSHHSVKDLINPLDRRISRLLLGADRTHIDNYGYLGPSTVSSKFKIDPGWTKDLCDLLVESGRLRWTLSSDLPFEDSYPLQSINFQSPGEIRIEIKDKPKSKRQSVMEVLISCDGAKIDNSEIVKVADNGIVLLHNGLIKIANPEAIELWKQLFNCPSIEIAERDRIPFLHQLSRIRGLPPVDLPDSWKIEQVELSKPRGILNLHHTRQANQLSGEVLFEYGDRQFSLFEASTTVFNETESRWSERDFEAESQLVQQLLAFPIKDTTQDLFADHDLTIHQKHLINLIDELANKNWIIHLKGKPVRQASNFDISVQSGQDWFDLLLEVNFEGEKIALPSLLNALAKKESYITLADGSSGRIPSDILERYARLAKFGFVEDDKIRFRPSQAMLLDAMLDAQTVNTDRGFKTQRDKLKSFKGIKPKSPPKGFKGELRNYQKDGLGWLHFLRDSGLGGCLADDMGLGKTIQVLSLLESRRTRRVKPAEVKNRKNGKKKSNTTAGSKQPIRTALVVASESLQRKPSIVVAPTSLIFNWVEEAAKFTPRLRIVDYIGTTRQKKVEHAIEQGGFDVLLTTYGTLRKDIGDLSQIKFDYAILDESQAIKNSKAQCAKSSRLLQADHRLAMTGTPIENHLGELWSLFEFLNPGMLGNSTNFSRLTNQKKNNEAERDQTLSALSRAISPFLLRRTKEQVLTDLPPKVEQTLYCEMLPAQKKKYNELKEYYRVKLAKRVATKGIGQSKIQVLEALLRLRQAACDPRLLDDKSKPGAKLDLLGQQITEIVSEGHKVLVFSQFTSYLALAKQQFDDLGIQYEYLDGQSSNRARRVKRFQEDESVSAFLISLKAGGHGLNLTAADYVFILDPWWNPAVEAQAIDRAHRMGQANPVIAYRMICQDTVEEKIVKLQDSKRELADKIIRSDDSLIRSLTEDDLMMLFG